MSTEQKNKGKKTGPKKGNSTYRRLIKEKNTDRKAKTKTEKSIERMLLKEWKKLRPNSDNLPLVLFVRKDTTGLIPIYSNGLYDPVYIEYGYEYLAECFQSYYQRKKYDDERFKKRMDVQHEILKAKVKAGAITGDEAMAELDAMYDNLGDAQYMPVIQLPSIEGFSSWVRRKKNTIITIDTLQAFRDKDPNFAELYATIIAEQKNTIFELSANGQGKEGIFKMILKNNHGMADETVIKDETGTSGLFGKLYALIAAKQLNDQVQEELNEPRMEATDVEATIVEPKQIPSGKDVDFELNE